MKKHIKDLVNKPVCEITFDDIIDLQLALKRLIELEKSLREIIVMSEGLNNEQQEIYDAIISLINASIPCDFCQKQLIDLLDDMIDSLLKGN